MCLWVLCTAHKTMYMKTSSESNGRSKGRKKVVIATLALLTLWGSGTTAYYWSQHNDMTAGLNDGKLANERLLAEKLQLEKQLASLSVKLDKETEALGTANHEASDLRRRVEAAIARSRNLEGAARKNRDMQKELTELRSLKQQLEASLASASGNERQLRDQLNTMTRERDELATRLEEHLAGAQMVNNAEVDALRGRKGKLTVVARRTKQIRMAFDLPKDMAHTASFKVITPDGRSYSGSDPAISMTVSDTGSEPTAAVELIPGLVKDRASRVHLTFTPEAKLKPGSYRIDVMSGSEYLNTVLLNLR